MVCECDYCRGSGEIAIDAMTGSYRSPGPVPCDAKGVAWQSCPQCRGIGYTESDDE